MKEGTKDLYSYEYVFYTSEARSHELNHYQFEFPGTWRTKVGGDLILAIRGLHLKKTTRSFELSSTLSYFAGATDDKADIYVFAFVYNFGQFSTIADMITSLNTQWDQQCDRLYDANRTVYDLIANNHVHWRLNLPKNRIELSGTEHEMNRLDVHLSFESHPDPDQAEVFQSENLNYGHYFGREAPPGWGVPAFKTWNRQDLLLTADFITQAENQHLGYTDSEYSIFKEYEIEKNTPYFTISLCEDETRNPIELPADKKDYVVIEAVISRKCEV
jgi:hypothetical protein